MSQIKIKFLKGLVEFVSIGELPTPLVYALAFLLVAVGIRIVLWAF
jgi:hypothetical protein